MNTQKTFNFRDSSISSLPLSNGSAIAYYDIGKSFSVENCKLMLLVGKTKKSFYLLYRKTTNGKNETKKIKLGDYGTITLKQARDKYKHEAMLITEQTDSYIQEYNNKDLTVEECLDFYLKDNDISKNEEYLFNAVRSQLGHLPVKDLNKTKVREFYIEQFKNKNFYSANARREVVQRIWNYNAEWNPRFEFLKDVKNPATHQIAKNWKKTASNRVVETEQIKPLWEAIEQIKKDDIRDLIKLFFYLGQHPYSEICNMKWEQISKVDDWYWWTMEEGFHKDKRIKHSVPLHPKVYELIEARKGMHETYVFVSNTRKDSKGDLMPYNKSSFTKHVKRLKEALGDNEIDFRCFRATVSTKIKEIDITNEPSYFMGQTLGGVSNEVYIRSEFRPLKIKMANDWINYIEEQING